MSNISELSVITKIVPYCELDDELKRAVDCKITEISKLSSEELLTYGIESQVQVTQYANRMITEMSKVNTDGNIDDIIDDILGINKNIIPKRGILIRRKAKSLTEKSKKIFVGKIDELRENIEIQVGRLIEDNIRHEIFVDLLLQNVKEHTENIIAIKKYIEDVEQRSVDAENVVGSTENKYFIERLNRKKDLLAASRTESLQTAVSSRIIQNNNITLIDRLQGLLMTAVPMLQNQVLLKVSIQDTKIGLDTCENVGKLLNDAMRMNTEELKEATQRLGIDFEGNTELTLEEMGKSILDIANELKTLNSNMKEELGTIETRIGSSEENLTEIFNNLTTKDKY